MAKTEITVYTYDSFSSKGGLGEFLKANSEKAIGVKTRFVTFGSAGEALNQIAMEGGNAGADILLGIDQNLVARATEMAAFLPRVETPGVAFADKFELGEFVPFDYGFLAFVYDSRRTTVYPTSLEDFSKREVFRKKVVMADPRTSSVGLSFLAWTRGQFSNAPELETFWRNFSRQLVTISPGWSGSYGLFLKNQADFVLSYTTSPAYHRKAEKSDAYRSVSFPEGHFRQVEGVGVLKKTKNAEAAKKWVRYLLSEEVQKEVAERQWLYPARKGISLPLSFEKLGPSPRIIANATLGAEQNKKELLRKWTEWVAAPSN